jgi:hypothetical protein
MTQPELPPESAHFVRVFGEFMESVNRHTAQRPDDRPGVAETVSEHLGRSPLGVAVVAEQVPGMRSADADIAIETVVERAGGGRVVGIGGGEQRMHHSLSEIVEQDTQWKQFPLSAVDYVRTPVGPHATRRVVSFGLHLFHYTAGGEPVPVALLQRAANPRFAMAGSIEILTPDEDVAAALLTDLRATMDEKGDLPRSTPHRPRGRDPARGRPGPGRTAGARGRRAP